MSKKHIKLYKLHIVILGIIVIITLSVILYQNQKIDSIEKYKNNPNAAQTVESEIQRLMNIQSENGPMSLLQINCSELKSKKAIEYCTTRQKRLKEISGLN